MLEIAPLARGQHDLDIARVHAEHAVSIRETVEIDPAKLTQTRSMVAQARWPDRAQRARAHMLAKQTNETWTQAGPGVEDELAHAETWLTPHRVR
ncbi:MAG: hypothetical protein AAGF11_45535 [Myxococcota bacterium]